MNFGYAAGSTEANETINLPNGGDYILGVFPINGASDTYSLLDRDMQLHLLMRAMTSLR